MHRLAHRAAVPIMILGAFLDVAAQCEIAGFAHGEDDTRPELLFWLDDDVPSHDALIAACLDQVTPAMIRTDKNLVDAAVQLRHGATRCTSDGPCPTVRPRPSVGAGSHRDIGGAVALKAGESFLVRKFGARLRAQVHRARRHRGVRVVRPGHRAGRRGP
ncbi:hypothetical protein BBK82_14210 [Lentzea guizhouensis]|uniref:Uncharacterized protein n=1 Tax=Lentzea guizhouensis TaxID=1586287 RepID=A0A1B2HH53_9PSEU|nr:hypothetical protein BBK82_14210 [Lentzea guizhouensis]